MDGLLAPVIAPDSHVLAAVSGGADSVALLLLLKDAEDRGELRLSAAHFEHGIRGEASVSDARFVEALCDRIGVPLFVGSADVPARARAEHMGLEQAAREARYEFLAHAKARAGAHVIALAHHMDDQAETVMMHILRGSGLRGAAGMCAASGDIVRPLLDVPKAELIRYLAERCEGYVQDETNFEPDSPRNALRLNVMPELQRIYPGAAQALCRHARIIRDEDALMQSLACDWSREHVRKLPMGLSVDYSEDAPPAILRRVLLDAELICGCGFSTVERLMDIYWEKKGRTLVIDGVMAEFAGDALYLISGCARPPEGTALFDGASLMGICTIRMRDSTPQIIKGDKYRQVLKKSAFMGATLRCRRAGDKVRMLGAPGRRLLSDVFTDLKVPRPLRDFLPLLAVGCDVIWIPGIGISEAAKLEPGDEDAVELIYQGFRFV